MLSGASPIVTRWDHPRRVKLIRQARGVFNLDIWTNLRRETNETSEELMSSSFDKDMSPTPEGQPNSRHELSTRLCGAL